MDFVGPVGEEQNLQLKQEDEQQSMTGLKWRRGSSVV